MSGCLQNLPFTTRLSPSAGAAMLHPLFLSFLVQEPVDTADDVIFLVGHLRVEVDVRYAHFLGVHACDEVFHVAVVAVAFAEHHHAFDAAHLFEHKGVGLSPFGFIGLARTALVELELVGAEASHVGHGHVLPDAVLWEFRGQNLAEVGFPFRRGLFPFGRRCWVAVRVALTWLRSLRCGLRSGLDVVLHRFHHSGEEFSEVHRF